MFTLCPAEEAMKMWKVWGVREGCEGGGVGGSGEREGDRKGEGEGKDKGKGVKGKRRESGFDKFTIR